MKDIGNNSVVGLLTSEAFPQRTRLHILSVLSSTSANDSQRDRVLDGVEIDNKKLQQVQKEYIQETAWAEANKTDKAIIDEADLLLETNVGDQMTLGLIVQGNDKGKRKGNGVPRNDGTKVQPEFDEEDPNKNGNVVADNGRTFELIDDVEPTTFQNSERVRIAGSTFNCRCCTWFCNRWKGSRSFRIKVWIAGVVTLLIVGGALVGIAIAVTSHSQPTYTPLFSLAFY